MKDDHKAMFFQDLLGSELFTAEIALEDETYEALQKKLATMDVKSDVAVEYARIRGGLDVLAMLKSNRTRLVELARSRNRNS